MDDPDDPVVAESNVPSFDIVERKIKDIDHTIIIFRIYYFFSSFLYRFQLIKKDKMCMMEIPRALLENLHKNGVEAEQELDKILDTYIESSDCWADFKA